MPLPTNASLSLQGHSRPGEGVTKPKQAMIIRMSAQTLDALQNLSASERGLEFEFGDHAGIYIQDTFFPMRSLGENSSHELFLRSTSAIKPNGPLRLSANVIGRFNVELGEPPEKLTKQIHEKSMAAAEDRKGGKIQRIDPPLLQAKGAAKKGPRTTRVVQKSAGPQIFRSISTVQTRVPSPRPPSTSTSSAAPSPENAALRNKLIHYLALGSQRTDDIVKFVRGDSSDASARIKIIEMLSEFAEQEPAPKKSATSSSSLPWRLKQQTWLEVRPNQYADYTDSERINASRQARTELHRMKIPNSDSAWTHVEFRTGSGTASAHVASTSATNKNSSLAKKVLKPKAVPAPPPSRPSETKRPEVLLPPVPSSSLKRKEPVKAEKLPTKDEVFDPDREEGEISTPPRISPPTAPPRRLPGSKPRASVSGETPPSTPSTASPPIKKRTGPVDVRTKREAPQPSGSARPAPPLPPPERKERPTSAAAATASSGTAGKVREKALVKTTVSSRDRDRDRETDALLDAAGLKDTQVRQRERDAAHASRVVEKTSKKRPAPEFTDDESDESDWVESDRRVKVLVAPSAIGTIKKKSSAVTSSSQNTAGQQVREREKDRERDRDRERGRGDRDRDREKDRERDRDRELPLPKKPKIALPASLPPRPSAGLPPKPVARKAQEDLPASSSRSALANHSRTNSANKVASTSRTNGQDSSAAKKARRRSPVFTSSSSSDGEVDGPPKRTKQREGRASAVASTTATRPVKAAREREREREAQRVPHESRHHERERDVKHEIKHKDHLHSHTRNNSSRSSLPLPSDHNALRERYSTVYVEYIAAYTKLVSQKARIQKALRKQPGKALNGVASSGSSVTDADGEDMDMDLSSENGDMMNVDELEILSRDYQGLQEELEKIKHAWER